MDLQSTPRFSGAWERLVRSVDELTDLETALD